MNELRDLIGYIPQKNVLFSGDVASNLRFGDQDSSEEQWRQAAYIACADEFIEQSRTATTPKSLKAAPICPGASANAWLLLGLS